MIKMNALRIGNFVRIKGVPHRLSLAHFSAAHRKYKKYSTIKDYESAGFDFSIYIEADGVKITKEWISAFGFGEEKYNYYREHFPLSVKFKDGICMYEYRGMLTPIVWVHQLQNLFYALAGNELFLNAYHKDLK